MLPTEFSRAEQDIKELNAHPPVPGASGYWMLWDLETHQYTQSGLPLPDVGQGGGLAIYSLDNTLSLSLEGKLSVNTARGRPAGQHPAHHVGGCIHGAGQY